MNGKPRKFVVNVVERLNYIDTLEREMPSQGNFVLSEEEVDRMLSLDDFLKELGDLVTEDNKFTQFGVMIVIKHDHGYHTTRYLEPSIVGIREETDAEYYVRLEKEKKADTNTQWLQQQAKERRKEKYLELKKEFE